MKKWYLYALLGLLIIIVVGVLLVRVVPPLFSRSLTCHTWKSISVPQANQNSDLYSVALISANDVWIAGSYIVSGAEYSYNSPLVAHWDGQRWHSLNPPNHGIIDDTVYGIAAISDSDVWIVGISYTTPGTASALIAHWNGQTWHRFPDPTGSSSFTQLTGIYALADNDVWAVGSTTGPDFGQTLVIHWDGTTLKRVSSPNVVDENNSLIGISALSFYDIWAVGTSQGYQGSKLTLTEHWDGSRWNIVSSPDPSLYANALVSVAAVSTNDVWAVGEMMPNVTSRSPGGYMLAIDPPIIQSDGLIMHWDGQHWQSSPFPKLGQHQAISSITAYSSQDVWAAGFFVDDTSHGQSYHGFILHWDGTTWQSSQNSGVDYINTIGTSSAGGLWIVGLTVAAQNSGKQQPVAEMCS